MQQVVQLWALLSWHLLDPANTACTEQIKPFLGRADANAGTGDANPTATNSEGATCDVDWRRFRGCPVVKIMLQPLMDHIQTVSGDSHASAPTRAAVSSQASAPTHAAVTTMDANVVTGGERNLVPESAPIPDVKSDAQIARMLQIDELLLSETLFYTPEVSYKTEDSHNEE